MTKRTFDILEYCTTWLNSYRWGIFQDRWIMSLRSIVPESKNALYKGVWLFVDAEVDIVYHATGEMADDVIICPNNRCLYLYLLE